MVTGQKPAADAPSGAGAPRLHGDNALPQHAFDSLGDGLLSRILSFLDHEGRKAPRAAHPRIRAAADALVREVAACGFSQIARDNVTHLFRNAARWPRVEALQCRFVEPLWTLWLEAAARGSHLARRGGGGQGEGAAGAGAANAAERGLVRRPARAALRGGNRGRADSTQHFSI